MIVVRVALRTIVAVRDRHARKRFADYLGQIAVCEIENVRYAENFAVSGPIIENTVDQFGEIVGAEKTRFLAFAFAERQCA